MNQHIYHCRNILFSTAVCLSAAMPSFSADQKQSIQSELESLKRNTRVSDRLAQFATQQSAIPSQQRLQIVTELKTVEDEADVPQDSRAGKLFIEENFEKAAIEYERLIRRQGKAAHLIDYVNLASCYAKTKKFSEMLSIYKSHLPTQYAEFELLRQRKPGAVLGNAEVRGDEVLLLAYSSAGFNVCSMGNIDHYPIALEYYHRALQLAQELEEKNDSADPVRESELRQKKESSLLNIALISNALKKWDDAVEFFSLFFEESPKTEYHMFYDIASIAAMESLAEININIARTWQKLLIDTRKITIKASDPKTLEDLVKAARKAATHFIEAGNHKVALNIYQFMTSNASYYPIMAIDFINYGATAFLLGDHDTALEQLTAHKDDQSLDSDTRTNVLLVLQKAHSGKAIAQYRSGQAAEALKTFQWIFLTLEQQATPEDYYNAGTIAFQLGQNDQNQYTFAYAYWTHPKLRQNEELRIATMQKISEMKNKGLI